MKTIRVILAALCLLVAANIQAQHYVTGSLQGGWSSTFDNMDQTKDKGLFGAQIGVGYEWQYERLLVDIGAEFSYYKHRWSITDQKVSALLYDTEGWPFTYYGTVTDRTDDFSSTSVRIPILAGMQFNVFSKGSVYFLAGLVPDLHFNSSAHATGTLKTEGDYTEFYDILSNMANHGFYEIAQSTENDMRYNFDILGHVEAGVSFGQQQKYRVAAFAEVGILDIAPRTDKGRLTDPDFSQYMTVNLNNPYVSKEGAFASLHNYEVGLKFSVAINVGQNKKEGDKEVDDEEKLDSLDNAMQDSLDNVLFDEAQAQLEAEAEAEAQRSAQAAAAAIAEEERLAREQEEAFRRQQEAERNKPFDDDTDDFYTYQPKTFGPETELTKDDLDKGSQYILQKIYFDTDMSIVMIKSLPTLKQLYKHLVQYPDIRIKIIGHTDSQSTDYYNLVLSRRRAAAVKRILMRWGIDSSRLETEGRGEREPIATNQTAEGRQLNRRVVFEVL